MTGFTVSPVTSRRDRKAFIQFPFDLYRESNVWVPPLRMDVARLINPRKNAFFGHGDMQLFLARDASGRVAGRIAAIRNGMHLQKYDDAVGFFGFFETVDDDDVAGALLEAAAGWLRSQGLSVMRGPANPTLNDTAGLLVGGFDRQPSILMPYNFPYYEAMLARFGFSRSMTMWAYYSHIKYLDDAKLNRGRDLIMRRYPGLSARRLDMSRFEEEAATILDIYNDAWSRNWGHVPMTDPEFTQLASELKQIVDPRLVVMVEDEGEPVAFAISLPDLNYALKTLKTGRLLPFGLFKLLMLAKSGVIREIRMPLMGVRLSHQGRGLDAMLIAETINTGREIGVQGCEMSWVLDTNMKLRNALEAMNGVKDKEYALFDAPI
ncbi:MAG: hypothetical protein RIE53_12970 [Rhodothermales bacterium]